MRERGADLTIFSPRASFMAHHIGGFETSSTWAAICNELIHRVSQLFPGPFRRLRHAAAVARRGPEDVPAGAGALRQGVRVRRRQPEPGSVRRTLERRRRCPIGTGFPIYEALVEYDIPAMIHVSTSCNPCFHTTGSHYLNADTTAFMQCLTADLFKEFPKLRFVIPHGGGAVPYHWGRFRGIAQDMKKPPLADHLLKNIYFDTCVYHQAGIDLLTRVMPVDNILFGSEMIGAVRGIDPESGHYYDDTKRYIEATPNLDAAARRRVYEGNARRVYPRLDAALRAAGRRPS